MNDYGKNNKEHSAQKDNLQKHPKGELSEMRELRDGFEVFIRCFNIDRKDIPNCFVNQDM